jgi:hypothetical protein
MVEMEREGFNTTPTVTQVDTSIPHHDCLLHPKIKFEASEGRRKVEEQHELFSAEFDRREDSKGRAFAQYESMH